jgi:hypothetical protein
MHKAWPRLLKRMNANKADAVDDRNLVIASRTWFCLYLFEHQSVIIFLSIPPIFIVVFPVIGYLMEQDAQRF